MAKRPKQTVPSRLNEVARRDEPTAAWLDALIARRPPTALSAEQHAALSEHLPREVAQAVADCCTVVLRHVEPTSGVDTLGLRRCKIVPWCPVCTREVELVDAKFLVGRLASIAPDLARPLDITHIQIAFPDWLKKWSEATPTIVRDAMAAIQVSIARTLGFAPEGRASAARVAWRRLGAVAFFRPTHPDLAGWPAWTPRVDILLVPVMWNGESLLERAEPTGLTASKLTDELQRASADTWTTDQLPQRALSSWRKVRRERGGSSAEWGGWKVKLPDGPGPAPLGTDKLSDLVRSWADISRITIDDEGIATWSQLEADGSRSPRQAASSHIVNALLAHQVRMSSLESRHYLGILSRRSYAQVCAATTRVPVRRKVRNGKRIRGAYVRTGGAGYRSVDPRRL